MPFLGGRQHGPSSAPPRVSRAVRKNQERWRKRWRKDHTAVSDLARSRFCQETVELDHGRNQAGSPARRLTSANGLEKRGQCQSERISTSKVVGPPGCGTVESKSGSPKFLGAQTSQPIPPQSSKLHHHPVEHLMSSHDWTTE